MWQRCRMDTAVLCNGMASRIPSSFVFFCFSSSNSIRQVITSSYPCTSHTSELYLRNRHTINILRIVKCSHYPVSIVRYLETIKILWMDKCSYYPVSIVSYFELLNYPKILITQIVTRTLWIVVLRFISCESYILAYFHSCITQFILEKLSYVSISRIDQLYRYQSAMFWYFELLN